MLACIGPVTFDLKNDLQSLDFEAGTTLVAHDVMGAAPVYEVTGDEEATITLKGTLYPIFFQGALTGISLLEAARKQRTPLTMMRGDFTPMGWVLIKSISHSHSDLDAATGVGQTVEYTVNLVRITGAGGDIASILRLFL